MNFGLARGILIALLTAKTIFWSCEVRVEPIRFGEDLCSYCRMTIADARFSAQLVTTRGKNFKFDAIECMVWYLHEQGDTTLSQMQEGYAFILVWDYLERRPVSVDSAIFLIADSIRSPMGAHLAAFSSREQAEEYARRWNGTLYTWDHLMKSLSLPTWQP